MGDQDITIAVMGPTGTGKSSLIRLVTDSDDVDVGHSLESETSGVACYEYYLPNGRKVSLIDTPGFDDSRADITDTDILVMVSEYLNEEYRDGRKLSGVIYMHNIKNTRMGGTGVRNIRLLQKLVGDDCLSNVLIVTTMWNLVEPTVGQRREEELKSKATFFKPLIDAGARLFRHDSGTESAQKIINIFLGHVPKTLLIQEELNQPGASLLDTSAGAEIAQDLVRLNERDRKKLQQIEEELAKAVEDGDEALVADLLQEQERLQNRLESREHDRKTLQTDVSALGLVLGARIGQRALGDDASGAVVGGIAGLVGAGLVVIGNTMEEAFGVPEERSFKHMIPDLVEMTERRATEFASMGREAFDAHPEVGTFAGGAIGATVGVYASVLKGVSHIISQI